MSKAMFLSLSLMLALAPIQAQEPSDTEAVRAAVLDYVEGIYLVQPERIKRSVHKSLRKHGFWRNKEGQYKEGPMTFEQLLKLAGDWNKDGHVGKDAPKVITIYEVQDQTASAKLVADWGSDYFHLAKYDGKWMITNILWQSHPPAH